ncbi:MAG: DNA translocase FtsK [Candidatus Andersenbacteria bacterium]
MEHTELHRFADALQQAAERESIADMLEKSKNLVSKTGRASTNYFRQQLGLSAKKCEALLQLLEIEGVVGHLNRGNVGREVLISESPGPTPEATVDLGICEQCEQKRALVTMGLRGKRKVWCLGCVRIAFPRTWARVVAHSLNRNVIEQELFREATAIAIKNGGLSNKMLAREMQIGYGYAVKLVKILEDRGVLSREAHGEKKRRIVLISEDDFATLPILPCAVLGSKTGRSARMCNQCKQPSFPLVHLRRNYYCISCARRRFGPKWALALAHSCNRAEIMEILLEEAVKLLPSTTKITEKMLQRELVVGPQVSHELMELLEQRGMVVRVTSQGVHHRVIHLGASHEINDQPARLIQSFALNCGQHDPLYQEGKLLVIAKGKASVNFLAKSLYTSADRARRILRGLANEGIIESLSQKKDKHNKALTRLPSGDPSNSLILNLRQLVALVGKRGRVARILRDAISTLEATQHKQKE